VICLENLIDKAEAIKSATADVRFSQQLIATIYVLDFPNNDWPTLLQKLSDNTDNKDEGIQRSAVLTLGYICDKLSTSSLTLPKSEIEMMLTGIAKGLKETQTNEDIRKTSIVALQDSLTFLTEILEEEPIMELVLTLALRAALSENQEIAVKALEVLSDLYKACYHKLTDKYMRVLADKTIECIKSKTPSIAIAATEFWNSAAYLENKRERKRRFDESVAFHNHVAGYAQQLTVALLENLMKKDSEEESGKSVHRATFEALTSVNRLGSQSNREVNFEFIKLNINAKDEQLQISALTCFEAMILGSQGDTSDLVLSSIEFILKILRQSINICKAVLRLLRSLAEKYPHILLNDKVCVEWLELSLTIYLQDPSLGLLVCELLKESANSLPKLGQSQGYFVTRSDMLIHHLLKASLEQPNAQDLQLVTDSLVAVMWIIKSLRDPAKLLAILAMLSEALAGLATLNRDLKSTVKEGVLLDILSCVYQLGRLKVDRSDLSAEVLATIYDFAYLECKHQQSGFADALLVLVAIAFRELS